MRTLLILTTLTTFLIGCETTLDPVVLGNVCPAPRVASDEVKQSFKDCCTVIVDGKRRPLPQYRPMFHWLAQIGVLNAELRECRRK